MDYSAAVSPEAKGIFHEQLRLRHRGIVSDAPPDASFADVKPHFYADARLLTADVARVYQRYQREYPPYGLRESNGEATQPSLRPNGLHWFTLERLLSRTVRHAFNEAVPRAPQCPYHQALGNLGSMSLESYDDNHHGLDRLREVTFPGAFFAPATVVNILRRIPAIATQLGATTSAEELATHSMRSLLDEPLHHPQQYAKAFTFSISDGQNQEDLALDRSNFLPTEVIQNYMQVSRNQKGEEIIEWSQPTENFTLRASVSVANRLKGPESERFGEHIVTYEIGTRLGDIAVNEPTIGCPGRQLAYIMWKQSLHVITHEDLWSYTKVPF